MSKVKVIEADKSLNNYGRVKVIQKRVAPYCRVSTDSSEQKLSYNSQVIHYRELVESNPDWKLVEIYAYEGITGTQTDKRTEFQRMINDAMDGRIDLIITKSISRFARNTLDTLKYVRQLKERNIAILFEKENINTLTMNGEMLLVILSSLAQQESESISKNVTMGLKMKMKRGELVGYNGCLGYNYDHKDKTISVNHEEAEIVKYIFRRYLEGTGTYVIGKELTNLGYKTKKGGLKWYDTTVRAIIRNEKYMGDLLLGKTVTIDPITHRRVKNHGQADKYYIENHHEAIISREVFEKAQEIMESRGIKNKYKGKPQKTSNKYAFSGIMKCSFCGGTIMRRTHHAGTQHEKYVWQCSKSIRDGRKACPHSKAIDERVLKAAFVEGYSRVTKHNANLVDEFLVNIENALDMTSIENGIGSITKKITKQESISEQLLNLKLNDKIDDNTYDKKYNEINKTLNELKCSRDDLLKSLSEEQTLSERIRSFKSNINTEQPMQEFDRLSFESYVENVLIGKMDDTENHHPYVVTFVLKSGLKFEGLAERQYKKKGLKLMETKMYSSSEIEKSEPYSFYKDTTCGDCGKTIS